jgi:hypothetical protein
VQNICFGFFNPFNEATVYMADYGYAPWMHGDEGILFVQMGGTIDKDYP